MSDSRLIDQDRELQSTREDVRDIFNARVLSVHAAINAVSVVSDYHDGGVSRYPKIFSFNSFVIGDKVLIARDEHDAWKIIEGGSSPSIWDPVSGGDATSFGLGLLEGLLVDGGDAMSDMTITMDGGCS